MQPQCVAMHPLNLDPSGCEDAVILHRCRGPTSCQFCRCVLLQWYFAVPAAVMLLDGRLISVNHVLLDSNAAPGKQQAPHSKSKPHHISMASQSAANLK